MKTQLLFKLFFVFAISLFITCKTQTAKKQSFGGNWKAYKQSAALGAQHAPDTSVLHAGESELGASHQTQKGQNTDNFENPSAAKPLPNIWHATDTNINQAIPYNPTSDTVYVATKLPYEKNTKTAAILGLIGLIVPVLLLLLAPFILGFGIAGLKKIKKNPGKYRGKNEAIAAIAVSSAALGILLILIILAGAGFCGH